MKVTWSILFINLDSATFKQKYDTCHYYKLNSVMEYTEEALSPLEGNNDGI